jgi:hypothetical protein
MTETEMTLSATAEELERQVERIVEALPEGLADEWAQNVLEIAMDEAQADEPDTTVLRVRFWDAVRAVLRELIAHNVDIRVSAQPKREGE